MGTRGPKVSVIQRAKSVESPTEGQSVDAGESRSSPSSSRSGDPPVRG